MKNIILASLILLPLLSFSQLVQDKKMNDGTIIVYYNKMDVTNKENANHYAIYNINNKDEIIDFVRLYNMKGKLVEKFQAHYISKKYRFEDIIYGEDFFYDNFGNIRRKSIHNNPKKLISIHQINKGNYTNYFFRNDGSLVAYEEINNGDKILKIEYDINQNITYASDLNESYYYQGNPTSGYEMTYFEDFEDENTIIGKNLVYENGSRIIKNGKYEVESKVFGGLTDIIDVDFDLNKEDWMASVSIEQIYSNEAAGFGIGPNINLTSYQMFLNSTGNYYFNHYNFFNGVNISDLTDWYYYGKYFVKKNSAVLEEYPQDILGLLKVKDLMVVSINGKVIYKTKFTPVSSNKIGLVVDKKGNKVIFDNFTVKKLNSSIPNKFFNPKKYIANKDVYKSNGSGFLLNTDGYIATNYHVIEGAKEIYIQIGNKDMKCKLIATDINNDLAIIKLLEKPNIKMYSTLTNDFTETGNDIFVLGYPYALSLLGSEIKLTDGKISSQSGFRGEEKTYQISAPIQPGNSGGPLFNKNGDIIGIVSSKFTAGENVGYAIKIDYLKDLLAKNNINYGRINSIKNMTFVNKVKQLQKTTVLLKTK